MGKALTLMSNESHGDIAILNNLNTHYISRMRANLTQNETFLRLNGYLITSVILIHMHYMQSKKNAEYLFIITTIRE